MNYNNGTRKRTEYIAIKDYPSISFVTIHQTGCSGKICFLIYLLFRSTFRRWPYHLSNAEKERKRLGNLHLVSCIAGIDFASGQREFSDLFAGIKIKLF